MSDNLTTDNHFELRNIKSDHYHGYRLPTVETRVLNYINLICHFEAV